MPDFDHATMAKAFTQPGIDPRQWISFGLVADEVDGQPPVVFDPDVGPLVSVTLQPSGAGVVCRVAAFVAGNGEGEWFPFIPGDEVIVAVPMGDEKAGCTILGRLYGGVDAWPRRVAGQDATSNTFGFKRMRCPYIVETESALLFRSSTTKAFLSMDQKGAWVMANGSGHMVTVNDDFLGMQDAANNLIVQLNLHDNLVAIQAGAATIQVRESGDSLMLFPERLLIGTSSSAPTGHAVTLEQVAVMLQALITAISAAQPGAWIGAVIGPTAVALVNAAIAAATVLPIAPLQGAITAALSVPPDPAGTKPGVGSAGLLVG